MVIFICKKKKKTQNKTTSSKPLTQPAINLSFKYRYYMRVEWYLLQSTLYGLKYSLVTLFWVFCFDGFLPSCSCRATLKKKNLKNSLNVKLLTITKDRFWTILNHFEPHVEALKRKNEKDARLFTLHYNLAVLVNTLPLSLIFNFLFHPVSFFFIDKTQIPRTF